MRLVPTKPTKLGIYDLDCVVIEDEESFRLEVGVGLENLWIVPIAPNGRLRLITFGPVVSHDEPSLVADPYVVEYAETWSGDLGTIGHAVLTSVRLTMGSRGYRCECTTRDRTWVLAYGGV